MALSRFAAPDRLLVLWTAGLFAGLVLTAALRLGLTALGLARLPVVLFLAVAAVLDIRSRRIPNWLSLPGLAWAAAASLLPATWRPTEAVLGVVVCGGLMLLLALLSRGAIGGGDYKLAATIGAALGAAGGLGVLAVAHLSAALVVLPLALWRRTRTRAIPLGPFLALPAILALVLG